MNCEESRLGLIAYLDDELGRPEREPVAAHLQTCPACRELARKMEQSLAVFKAMVALEPPAKADEQEIAEPGRSWFQGRRAFWLAAAAALIFLAGAGVYVRRNFQAPSAPFSNPAGVVSNQDLNEPVPDQTFVYHGRGISRQNSLDLKI